MFKTRERLTSSFPCQSVIPDISGQKQTIWATQTVQRKRGQRSHTADAPTQRPKFFPHPILIPSAGFFGRSHPSSHRPLENSDNSRVRSQWGQGSVRSRQRNRAPIYQTSKASRDPGQGSWMWIPSSPEEFCWGNTVIGQLANGLKKDAVVDWKVLQWADCSSGGGELLLSCKGQASPLYCGSEWDRVSGVGSGQA